MTRRGLAIQGAIAISALVPASAGATPTEPGELVNPLFAPVNCEICHGFAQNAAGQTDQPPYSPLRTWQGTMMANSARDPVFWAGLAVADGDVPGETELCVRCHAPRAFLEGNGTATSIDDLTAEQREGVECELCHRAFDDGVTPAGNAMYAIDDTVMGTNVPRRGPWDYSDGVPNPPHDFIADPYIGSSRLCGICHDVTTPTERVDDDGEGLGVDFNEQRTYSEWLGSDYAVPGEGFRSCQDCHMPAVDDMPGCQAYVNQYSHPTGGRRHDLVGANRFMIELLRQEYGSEGSNELADLFFDLAIERTDEFLPTAATLQVDPPDEVELGAGLVDLTVTVTNNTGHKLPTGYSEGRVMWLEVIARYGDEVVASSGAWDQDAGMQRDPLLRTYEGVGEQYATGTTFHLLLNDHWAVDSRIPPAGLLPDLQTDPIGDRYTLLPDGTWPNFDEYTYDFPGAPEVVDATPEDATDDALDVTVRLLYLVNTAEYIEFLGEQGGEAGAEVAGLFDLAGGAPPLVLAEQTLAIPIVGFGPIGGSTGAASSGGGSDDTTGGEPATGGSGTPDGTASDGEPGDDTAAMTTAMTTTVPGDDGTDGAGSTDDGAAADGDDDEGCGCRTGRAGPGAWLVPASLIGIRRRRRARGST